jgi:hypothetical protein
MQEELQQAKRTSSIKSENKIKNKKAPNFCKIYWMQYIQTLAKIQVKFIMHKKQAKIENKN